MPENHQIDELIFANHELIPDRIEERIAIFDIHCRSMSGENFIVEMQRAKMEYFMDRALYYSTFPIREQAKKGKWDYKLSHVYFIAIMGFQFVSNDSGKKNIKTEVMLKDQDGDVFYDKLHFCFLQMPFFNKAENQLETKFDKWLYFLKT